MSGTTTRRWSRSKKKRAQFDLSEIIWLYAGRRLEISHGYFLNLR